MSFDEAGIASQALFNLVCWHIRISHRNFVSVSLCFAKTHLERFYPSHCDAYQGNNAKNINIPEEVNNLPTTQKAVVSSIIQQKLGKDPN